VLLMGSMATTYPTHFTTRTYDDFDAVDTARDDGPGLVRTVVRRYMQEGVGTQAAGIGLFTLIALPATLLALAAIYGMVAAPADVAVHMATIAPYLPAPVAGFLERLLDHVTAASPRTLTVTAVGSIGFALLAAQRAMAATMGALDRIGHLHERGSFWRRQIAALALALIGIGVLGAATYLVFAMPLMSAAAIGLLAAILYLAILYRNAPAHHEMTWRGAITGAPVAIGLAGLASLGLSWWVSRVSDYQALYGAAGSMVVVLVWAYLMALSLLVGGLIASETGRRQHAAEAAWNE
jgi:membrane protein